MQGSSRNFCLDKWSPLLPAGQWTGKAPWQPRHLVATSSVIESRVGRGSPPATSSFPQQLLATLSVIVLATGGGNSAGSTLGPWTWAVAFSFVDQQRVGNTLLNLPCDLYLWLQPLGCQVGGHNLQFLCI